MSYNSSFHLLILGNRTLAVNSDCKSTDYNYHLAAMKAIVKTDGHMDASIYEKFNIVKNYSSAVFCHSPTRLHSKNATVNVKYCNLSHCLFLYTQINSHWNSKRWVEPNIKYGITLSAVQHKQRDRREICYAYDV